MGIVKKMFVFGPLARGKCFFQKILFLCSWKFQVECYAVLCPVHMGDNKAEAKELTTHLFLTPCSPWANYLVLSTFERVPKHLLYVQ